MRRLAPLALLALAATSRASLVSYWSFNEASGPAVDAISGNDGTFGPFTMRIPGALGSGVSFQNDGNSYVDVGNGGLGDRFKATTGLTIEAMIHSSWSGNFLDYDEVFRKQDGSDLMLLSFQYDNVSEGRVLSLGLNIGGTYDELDMPLDGLAARPTLSGLEDGAWHHVVGSYDSVSGLEGIWIDGTIRYSTTRSGLIQNGGAATATIGNISPDGINANPHGEPFAGGIDEVAYYNSALTDSEVATHYRNIVSGRNYFGQPVPEPMPFAALVFGAVALIRRGRTR